MAGCVGEPLPSYKYTPGPELSDHLLLLVHQLPVGFRPLCEERIECLHLLCLPMIQCFELLPLNEEEPCSQCLTASLVALKSRKVLL